MELFDIVLLAGAGIVGGAVNAIAGGGTFFTFPAMMASGLDPLVANASNVVAIWPGHAAAVPAYRYELRAVGRPLVGRCAVAAVGGLLGAGLLLWSGAGVFAELVPWLLLAATLLFAGGTAIRSLAERARLTSPLAAGAIEFAFAVYGGYFGAGLGVLLLASLMLVGVRDMQMANAQKNLLAALITTISLAVFVSAGIIAWPETLVVLAGAIVGGYAGARLAQRIPANVLRAVVVAVGFVLSVYYFWR